MLTHNSVVSSSTSKFEKNPISCLENEIEPLMLNALIDFNVYVLILNLMHKSASLHIHVHKSQTLVHAKGNFFPKFQFK